MTDRDKFEQMLSWDRDIYMHLVTWKAFLLEFQKKLGAWDRGDTTAFKTKGDYDKAREKFGASTVKYFEYYDAYNARQKDYRENKAYQLGKSIAEFNDKAVTYFKNFWNGITGAESGVGALPLLIPISLIAGGTIIAGVAIHFVAKYYTDTANSLPNVAKAVADLETINPVLAENLVKKSAELSALSIKENADTGFGNQLGKGAKVAIYGVTGAAFLGLLFKVAKEQNWI